MIYQVVTSLACNPFIEEKWSPCFEAINVDSCPENALTNYFLHNEPMRLLVLCRIIILEKEKLQPRPDNKLFLVISVT